MKLWALIILIVLIVVVIAQNSEVVTVRFLFWEASLSRIVLLIVTLAVGVIIGFLGAKLPKRRSHDRL